MDDTTNPEPRWIAGIEPERDMQTQSMTSIYEKECREQPERLAQLLRAYGEDQPIVAELDKLRQVAFSPGPILFVGMGASYCSSITGSVWLQSCGRSSFVVDAGEWLHYSPRVWDQVAASILIPPLVRVRNLFNYVKKARAGRSLWSAITKKVHAGHLHGPDCRSWQDQSMGTRPRHTRTPRRHASCLPRT